MATKSVDPIDPNIFALAFFTVLENFDEQSESLLSDALEIAAEFFDADATMVDNFIRRFSALMDCIENSELAAFSLFRDDQIKLHPALMHAAAQSGLNRNGKFKRSKFVEMVRFLQANDYPDWEFTKPESED